MIRSPLIATASATRDWRSTVMPRAFRTIRSGVSWAGAAEPRAIRKIGARSFEVGIGRALGGCSLDRHGLRDRRRLLRRMLERGLAGPFDEPANPDRAEAGHAGVEF